MISSFLLFIGLSHVVNAGVYRWVDDQGRVQFGDRPPQTSDAKEVKIKKAPRSSTQSPPPQGTSASDRLRKQQQMLDAYREEREEKQQQKQERKAKKAERAKDCAYAKSHLEDYRSSGRIFEPLPGDKKRYLSDEEYKKEVQRMERIVKQRCR